MVLVRGNELIPYTYSVTDNVVPCSDAACEIIGVGEEVKGWKIGDRVCANFSPDHIHGAVNAAIANTALGGQQHGVLTQYRTFPAYVGSPQHPLELVLIEFSVSRENTGTPFL